MLFHLLKYLPTRCPCCGSWVLRKSVASRRMSTAYVDPASNYLLSCKRCWEQSEAEWAERWAEYYSGLM